MQQLTISPNGHYFHWSDGRPFFFLGDTAWELFYRPTLDEVDYYLHNRAEKGFTVLQAVVLSEFDGVRVPNVNGDRWMPKSITRTMR
ncbi:MAG TPA: DUF4038 domain-containing protein [Armatimonadota bacterium]|jgi:hypothetical protein